MGKAAQPPRGCRPGSGATVLRRTAERRPLDDGAPLPPNVGGHRLRRTNVMISRESLNAFEPRMLSILRIVSALIFFAHGSQKLLGFPPASALPAAYSLPDRKSTRLNSRHYCASRMPSSALQKNQQTLH